MNSKEVAEGVMKIADNACVRAYQVQSGDVIEVNIKTFFTNPLLWRSCWQIQGFYDKRLTHKFLWWKRFPNLRKTKVVKLMYIGE